MKNEDSDPLLEVLDFGKKYGEFVAVDGLNFEVRAGEIVGMVGANGAEKTTTLQASGERAVAWVAVGVVGSRGGL